MLETGLLSAGYRGSELLNIQEKKRCCTKLVMGFYIVWD